MNLLILVTFAFVVARRVYLPGVMSVRQPAVPTAGGQSILCHFAPFLLGKMPPKKKAKTDETADDDKKTKIQGSLGFVRVSPEEQGLQKDVLLTDEIYKNCGRSGAGTKAGHYFHYTVLSYDRKEKKFTLRYAESVIKPDDDSWESWIEDETGRELLEGVSLPTIEEGITRYHKAMARVNTRIAKEKQVAAEALVSAGPENPDDYADDIDELAKKHGPTAVEIFELDFELTGETGTTGPKSIEKRQWKHKTIDRAFWQTKNPTGSGWNTGVYTKELKSLINLHGSNKKYTKSIYRAKHMLRLRTEKVTVAPTKGMGFYPFEEDLPHHVRATFATLSTGIFFTFFQNPYVRDYTMGLNEQHRPLYHLKLMRLIRCVGDVLTYELYLFMTELYLLYHQSFVASTSDFWVDPVRKQSFGAAIANFMANRYKFKNGLSLFVPMTTVASAKKKT